MAKRLKHIVTLTICSIIIKLFYLGFAANVQSLDGGNKIHNFNYESYVDLAKQKDAFWYESIVTRGYHPVEIDGQFDISQRQSNWAFFPLYPLSNYFLSSVLKVEYDKAAFLLSLLFSILALLGIYEFSSIYFKDESIALYASLLFLMLPFHYYFSWFLTEALFFSILIWSFIFIQKDKTILASICCALLVLCRPNGLLLLLPIAIFVLENKRIQKYFSLDTLKKCSFLIAPLISFGVYTIYQFSLTGDFMVFSSAQEAWGKKFTWPWMCFFNTASFADQFNSFYVIGMMLLAIWHRNKWPLSFTILFWVSLLLPLFGGSIDSMPRYLSIIFPITLLLAQLFYKLKKRNAILIIIILLHFLSFYPYLRNWDVGF